MKKLLGIDIVGSAVLAPGASGVGTVTFTGPALTLNQILIVTNVTRNQIIYNFADATAGVSAFSNNVLTLLFNTSTYAASDVLQAFVDVPELQYPTASRVDRTDNLTAMLSRIVKLLESNAVVDQQQRQRLTVDSITSGLTLSNVTTVGTVSAITGGTITTVSAVNTLAGMDREQYINIARNTYANGIRSKLSFV
jgi:hypothetical protein